MSFAIINSKTVIGLINSCNEFCDFISKINPQAKVLDFKSINAIENDDSITSGEYIIENGDSILLVKKTIEEYTGWFNAKKVHVDVINMWSLFDCTIKNNQDMNDDTNINYNFEYASIQPNSYILQMGTCIKEKGKKTMEIVDNLIKSEKLKEENITIFSPNTKDWNLKYPNATVYNEYRKKVIRKVLTEQKTNSQKYKYIIIDDEIKKNAVYASKLMPILLSRGKELNIGMVLHIHSLYDLLYKQNLISYFDYIIMYKGNNYHYVEMIQSQYSSFATFDELYNIIYRQLIYNNILLIDNKLKNENLKDIKKIIYILE